MKKRKTNPKQYPQQAKWQKANMKSVIAKYRIEFVDEFKNACSRLGISQSDVIRKAMTKTIADAKRKAQ